MVFVETLQLLTSTQKENCLFFILNIIMSLEREESVLKCLVDVDVKRQPIFDCIDAIFPLHGTNVNCFYHALNQIQVGCD